MKFKLIYLEQGSTVHIAYVKAQDKQSAGSKMLKKAPKRKLWDDCRVEYD